MPSPNRKQPATRYGAFPGLTLLLFALTLLANTGSAQAAGCTRSHHLGPEVAHFELLDQLGALADPAGPEAERPLPRRSPCDGLRCSAGDPFSVPVAPAVSPAGQDWGLLLAVLTPPSLRCGTLAAHEPPVRPTCGGPSVFHPPR